MNVSGVRARVRQNVQERIAVGGGAEVVGDTARHRGHQRCVCLILVKRGDRDRVPARTEGGTAKRDRSGSFAVQVGKGVHLKDQTVGQRIFRQGEIDDKGGTDTGFDGGGGQMEGGAGLCGGVGDQG